MVFDRCRRPGDRTTDRKDQLSLCFAFVCFLRRRSFCIAICSALSFLGRRALCIAVRSTLLAHRLGIPGASAHVSSSSLEMIFYRSSAVRSVHLTWRGSTRRYSVRCNARPFTSISMRSVVQVRKGGDSRNGHNRGRICWSCLGSRGDC